jgi:hypothetical protein
MNLFVFINNTHSCIKFKYTQSYIIYFLTLYTMYNIREIYITSSKFILNFTN